MRPFTRISKAGFGTVFYSLLATTLLLPQICDAVPVVAEARGSAESGDLHGATRSAAERALMEAVRVVLRRHVTPTDLAGHASEVQRTVLSSASRYVQRYSIAEERWEDLEVAVRVEADVDRERILDRLASSGVPVAALPVKPRLLLISLDPAAASPARAMAKALQTAGYDPRISVGGPTFGGPDAVPEAAVSARARDAGCHFAVALETGMGTDGEAGEVRSGSPASREDLLPGNLWFDPGGGPRRSQLHVVAWLVDPSGRVPLARLEALSSGVGEDVAAAKADASARAGLDLGYQALQMLEQSGWVPSGDRARLLVGISGLIDPRLVEEIGEALSKIPEVHRVRLEEVAVRRATWGLDVIDSGLDWAAVLGSARLPRGQLESFRLAPDSDSLSVGTTSRWAIDARWRGP